MMEENWRWIFWIFRVGVGKRFWRVLVSKRIAETKWPK